MNQKFIGKVRLVPDLTGERRLAVLAWRAGYRTPEAFAAAIKESRKALRAFETRQFLPVPVLAEPPKASSAEPGNTTQTRGGEARESTSNYRIQSGDSRGGQKDFAVGHGAQGEPETAGLLAEKRRLLFPLMQQPTASSLTGGPPRK